MNEGVLVGGWRYVWLAYSLTAAVLSIYCWTVFARLREERSRAREEGAKP
jgi:hypothetical protein